MQSISMKVTAEQFEEILGYPPQHDDLERCNCDNAGQVGHLMCGWCDLCNKPRFICGHLVPYRSQIKNE